MCMRNTTYVVDYGLRRTHVLSMVPSRCRRAAPSGLESQRIQVWEACSMHAYISRPGFGRSGRSPKNFGMFGIGQFSVFQNITMFSGGLPPPTPPADYEGLRPSNSPEKSVSVGSISESIQSIFLRHVDWNQACILQHDIIQYHILLFIWSSSI